MATQRTIIKGADRLNDTLTKAGAELEEMKALHKNIGELVATEARPNAPVLTGALAGTIRGSGIKKGGVVRAGSARVPYAGVQEFGWPARNIAAQPALTDALATSEPAILDAYQAEIDRLLSKVKGA